MIRKILATFSTSIVIAAVTFLAITVLSNHFGATGYGNIGLFLFYLSIVMLINAICGSSIIVYILPKNNYGAVFWVTSCWSFVIPILFVGISSLVGLIKQDAFWLLAIGILQSLYINYLYFAFADHEIKFYNAVRSAPPLITLVIICTSLLMDKLSFNVYFTALLVSYLLPMIFLLLPIIKKLKGQKVNFLEIKNTFSAFLSFGGLAQITNLFQLLNYRISYFFLLACCGKSDVGVMTLALALVDGIWLFKNSASSLHYLNAATVVKDDPKISYAMIKASFVVTLVMVICVLIIPNKFYLFLFTKDFDSLKTLILFMTPGILAMALSSIIASYFSGSGKVYINFYASLAGFLVFVPSVYLLTTRYGLKGAAIANNIPLIVGSLVVCAFYLRLFRIKSV